MLLDGAAILIATLALIISTLSYWHARTVKITDLRIEAKKVRAELGEALARLESVHASALRNRKNLNATRGLLNSGRMQEYENDWNQNDQVIKRFKREFGEIPEPDVRSSQKHLEEIVVTAHRIRIQLGSLQGKYENDDKANRARSHEAR